MAEEGNRFNPRKDTRKFSLKQRRILEAQAEEEREAARLPSSELWELSKQKNRILELREANEQFSGPIDFDYEFTDEQKSAIASGYDNKERTFLNQSSSDEDLYARMEHVQSQREIDRQLSSQGWRGAVYQMAAGATDPVLAPLFLITGGGGAVGRAGLLAKTLRSSAIGAAEGVALESYLAGLDTQRDWKDVALSGAGGGVISGALTIGGSGIKRMVHGKQPDTTSRVSSERMREEAEAADAEMARLSKDIREQEVLNQLEEQLVIKSLHSIEPRANLIKELAPLAAKRLNRKDRKQLESEVGVVEGKIAEVRRISEEEAPRPSAGGTKRQRREQAEARQRADRALEERLDPLYRELTAIRANLKDNEPNQQAWKDINELKQGKIPERFVERVRQEVEGGRTDYARREVRRVDELAKRAKELREKRIEAEAEEDVQRPKGGGETAGESTVGAARAKGASNPEDIYPESEFGDVADKVAEVSRLGLELPGADFLRKLSGMGVRRLKSLYSKASESESPAVRGLNHELRHDPQGQSKGHIPAATRKENYRNRILAAEGGRESVAREMWAKERGINPIKMILGEGQAAREFDDAVVLQIKGVDSGSEAVRLAAEARRDMLSASLEMRKAAGESAFRDVDSKSDYWSVLYEHSKMNKAVSKYGKEEVIETLTGSYMNGRHRIPERAARVIANATYSRTMNRNLVGSTSTVKHISEKDLNFLREDMEATGIDTRLIDDFVDHLQDVREREGISDRAKMSLGADVTYQGNSGLRMVDLIDTSSHVTNKYMEESSAGAAIARSGFKSRQMLEDTIEEVEKATKNLSTARGRDKTLGDTKREKAINEDIEELKDTVKQLYGEDLDTFDAATPGYVKASRTARKATNLVALQWNGFASMAELSNQLVNLGVGTTMRNTRFKDFASFGKIRESEDLQGFSDLIGAYGQFRSSIVDNNYRMQTMDEADIGRLERIYNNGLGYVSNKSQLFSGFRSVQGGLENLAARSMQDRFVRMADGRIKPTRRDFDNMERAGLRRDQIEEVFQHIRDNPEYATVGGRRVRVFSGNGLDPDLKEDLGAAMTSMLSRNMQNSFVGDTPNWMSKEVGKMLTQFRSFGLVAIERQVMAGMRGDSIGMFLKTSLGLGIASGAYYSRVWLRSQGQETPREKREYWDRYTEPNVAIMGMFNMSPHLGLLGMGMEIGHTLGVIDQEGETIASRAGSRPLDPVNAIPALGVGTDIATAGRDLFKGIVQADGEVLSDAASDTLDILPIWNSAALGVAFAIAGQVTD